MKKAELIQALEAASGQSKAAVAAVVDALPGVLIDGMKEHGAVIVPNLAKFEARKREAREMRNPATGATISKPATTVPAIKPVKALKDAVAEF